MNETCGALRSVSRLIISLCIKEEEENSVVFVYACINCLVFVHDENANRPGLMWFG